MSVTEHRISYYLPYWEDKVNPEFDFSGDFGRSPAGSSCVQGVYAHELFGSPPYDGILVSLAVFHSKVRITDAAGDFAIRGVKSIKEYLRISACNKPLTVMGDCGAFSYVNQENPPEYASPANIARYYHSLGFDLGVSPDHIIVASVMQVQDGTLKKVQLGVEEKERRRQLSLANASAFLEYCNRYALDFTPVGAAQGYDTQTFVDSVHQLIDMGYKYVAIGGLVRYATPALREIVQAIVDAVNRRSEPVRLHLLGVLRLNLLGEFRQWKIASFDSASFMRKAWLRSEMNYFGVDGAWYAAVRVPPSHDPRVQKRAREHGIKGTRLSELERAAMLALQDYARSRISLENVLAAVMEYDALLERSSENISKLFISYKRTLQSRIWERCTCAVCRGIGIHVVIFRGANRNRRRGFHNTKLFYDTFIAGEGKHE